MIKVSEKVQETVVMIKVFKKQRSLRALARALKLLCLEINGRMGTTDRDGAEPRAAAANDIQGILIV